MSGRGLSLILPTLNERENIVLQIREVLNALPAIEQILVVDDDSTDGTRDVIEGAFPDEIRMGKLQIVWRRHEPGLTKSLQEGFLKSHGQYVGWMDCDLSMPAASLLELYRAVSDGRADLALGSRFVQGGEQKDFAHRGKDSRVEIVLSNWANRIFTKMLRLPVKDFTSGFIVIRREALSRLRWEGHHGEYFISFMFQASRLGLRILEIPYRCATRQYGESKTAGTWGAVLRNSFRYLRTVLKVMRAEYSGI